MAKPSHNHSLFTIHYSPYSPLHMDKSYVLNIENILPKRSNIASCPAT